MKRENSAGLPENGGFFCCVCGEGECEGSAYAVDQNAGDGAAAIKRRRAKRA